MNLKILLTEVFSAYPIIIPCQFINPLATEFIYLTTSAKCAGPINRPTIVKGLTLWTPEDGIPTFRKRPNAAKLRYTVQTASYQARRPTVYHRYGS